MPVLRDGAESKMPNAKVPNINVPTLNILTRQIVDRVKVPTLHIVGVTKCRTYWAVLFSDPWPWPQP
jgi:hypothetical protein